MYRNIICDLVKWQEQAKEHPLLLKGAKGVGKTWTMQDFAMAFFQESILIDFEKNEALRGLFEAPREPEEIDQVLFDTFGKDIAGGNLLIIFDEITVLKEPLTYILEYANSRKACAFCLIASFMGTLKNEEAYEQLYKLFLYPMTFEEFLTANKAQNLCKQIERQKVEVVADSVKLKTIEYLKSFLCVGGMPEAVLQYLKCKDYNQVEEIQQKILKGQRFYIEQNAPGNMVKKVLKIWDSIPEQLMKDNRKFMYNYVDEKARAREYENAVYWLVNTGFVRKVDKVNIGEVPLKEHVNPKSFELYHLDHGLLRAMSGKTIYDCMHEVEIFETMNGALTEQFVLGELTLNENVEQLYFWISGATARVDFVFEDDGEVIPVAVQAKVQKKAQSLKVFRQKYNNRMAIRISLSDLNFSKGILNIPLYGLWNF